MLDHLSIIVSDIGKARAFYDSVLGALGYARVMSFDHEGKSFTGYGPPQKPAFWIYGGYGKPAPVAGTHVAFLAPNRPAVDAFHRAALAGGARDDGKPGLRPDYHPNYYGAFVIDLDGNKLEAVCHAPGDFKDQFKPT